MMENSSIIMILVSVFLVTVSAYAVVRHRRPIEEKNLWLPYFPKVAVLMALRQLDDGLEKNLRSIMEVNYPNLEVYFAVDEMTDSCVPILEKVRLLFPHIHSRVVPAGHSRVKNPKANKLAALERHSDAELYWVLDSDIRVHRDSLRALVKETIYRNAQIVFSPIRCHGSRTFGSLVEMSYINNFLSGSVIAAWKIFRQRIVVGKSMLIEKKVLQHFGGFAYFTDVLAEDHWLGETFSQSGFSVRCNYTWVDNIRENSTVANFFSRMNRWAKLRFHLKRPVYFMEMMLNPAGLVIFFAPILKKESLLWLAGVMAWRLVLEYLVLFAVNVHDRKRPWVLLTLGPAVWCKDLLLMVIYFLPFFSCRVNWRGGNIRIGKYTLIALNQENLLYDGA